MNEKNNSYDLLIIGSGPAGFTAAIYGARGGLKTALIGGAAPGGQLLQTTEIENFPGFQEPINGADLMTRMLNQAKRLGAAILQEEAVKASLKISPFAVTGSSGTIYTARAIIAATGARARWLGLDSEKKFIGKGVSGCATCDGFFYRGKEVCVVGGGDTAVEDALFLTKFASRVYLVHRRDQLRANFRLQEKIKANPKIEIIYDCVPVEMLGDSKLKTVKIKNVKTGAMRELNLTGVFIAIGHTPETAVFEGQLKLDEEGYISTDEHKNTSVPGVFAAGDVMDRNYKQAIVAAGAGCMAAMEAGKYLEAVNSN
ncbi:MAG TPA: thioredoxin-disulfide reductase [Elusimicrobia bacterium]|nr:thioredoxin-disulfide reductase [Elusimicrobiota bacterium]